MGAEQIARTVGEQQWLDGIATPLQEAVRKLFESGGQAGRGAKDFLHGSALGHPLHPALIEIPLGAWSVAAIFDAIEVAGGDKNGGIADKAIGVGLIAALGAAATGLTDWSETDAAAKRIGITHGVMNVTATGLYALSLLLRKRSRSKAIGLSIIAYTVAMSAGFLGGHLTYGEQIGVDHTATADKEEPKEFTPVLASSKLAENKPAKASANGVSIVLVRQGDSIFALRDTCTHLGGPLSEGTLEGDSIRCPWHGSRFCLKDGSVLDGPAVFPERLFDVRERDGQIEVRARKE